jgi:S-adenosylmethionine/arginine decarboxylase-like enzyme
MPKYKVRLERKIYVTVDVEACDVGAAANKAMSEFVKALENFKNTTIVEWEGGDDTEVTSVERD